MDNTGTIVSRSDEVQNMYMIKHGSVMQFNEDYDYISTLMQGSYFGEYNIMFGLYSNITYKPNFDDKHYVLLYKIESK